MADTHETITDIIAEKRRRADEIERDCAEKMKRGEMISDCYARELVADIRREADRLEAAWKRDTKELRVEIERLKEDRNYSGVRERERLRAKGFAIVPKEQLERGDAAKLREAVCEILSYIESFHKYITPGKGKKLTALFAVADTIRNNARAALSAPPRNCDVGTVEEQSERLYAYCKAHRDNGAECLYCPLFGQTGGYCELVWGQLPYAEQKGGAK